MRNWFHSHNVNVNSTATISSAVVLGTIGVLSFIVQPGLVQGFVAELGLNEVEANELAFIEMLGVALATYVAALSGRLLSWRILIAISLLLASLGNLASAFVGGPDALSVARFVTGLGEGGVISLSFSVIGMTNKTERNLGIYLVLLLSYGALGLWAMPRAFATIGLDGIFLLWSLLTLASLLTLGYLPTSAGESGAERVSVRQHRLPMVVTAMLALLAFNAAIGIAWANLFLIGMDIRNEPQAIADALLVSQFVAIGGALLAVFMETRLGRWLPVSVGILGCALAVSPLVGDADYVLFVLAVCGFNFLWNMVLPFILSAVRDMRQTADLMTYSIAMQMTGLGFGPFIAARILDLGGSYHTVIWVTIAMLVASFALLAVPMVVHDRMPSPSEPSRAR